MYFCVKWDENFTWRRIVIGGPFSDPKHFSITDIWWITDIFRYETFWYCETKHTWQKLGIGAISPLIVENVRYMKQSETQKRSSANCLGTGRQHNFDGKSWYQPFVHKIFSYQKVSETRKGSSSICFGTVRQNMLDEKSWSATPLLSIKKFDTRKILKHRLDLYEKFRYCETKLKSTESGGRRSALVFIK